MGVGPDVSDPGLGSSGGAPPFGWYYFGPEPPVLRTNGPSSFSPGESHETHAPDARSGGINAHRNADLKEAFDRLSRGDLSADTIGKLLGIDDREFWKGALIGAAAALLANNLPILKSAFAGAMRSDASGKEPDKAPEGAPTKER